MLKRWPGKSLLASEWFAANHPPFVCPRDKRGGIAYPMISLSQLSPPRNRAESLIYNLALKPPALTVASTTFLAIHDALLAMFPRSCAGTRQAVIVSALLYPAQTLGPDRATTGWFRTKRREICAAIRGFYCIRSIQTTLQELRRDGFIDYRTDGESLLIRLTDRWRAWIARRTRQLEKCKIAQTLNTKEERNKPFYGKPYTPLLFDRSGDLPTGNGVSYADYKRICKEQNILPVAFDDWLT